MKKITKLSAILAIAITALAIPAWAQTTTEPQTPSVSGSGGGGSQVLPIQSQDELRNFALGNVASGTRYVNASSMDWNYDGAVTEVNATGNGAEDVLAKLFAQQMVYRVTNPDDQVNGWIYLRNKQGDLLFYGNAEYAASSVGKEKPLYNIWIRDIPMLENVQSAEVLALGEDGKTARRYQLGVTPAGQMLFPPGYSGALNGILAVRSTDGTLTTYRLSNPIGSTPNPTTETAASWKIEGHHVFSGNVNIIETWVLPTALVDLTHNDVEINLDIDVMGLVQKDGKTYFERPSAMVVTVQLEDGTWSLEGTVELDPAGPTTLKNVGPVKFRARFIWQEFGQPPTLYTGPEYNGGNKG